MKVYEDLSASEFRDRAWSGAEDTLEDLTDEQIEQIFNILESEGDDYSLTELNDFFWFERDTIAEWLGYSDYDQLMKRGDRGNEYYDDAIYNVKISHGADDHYSIDSWLDDAAEETGGKYDLLDDMNEDYDEDTDRWIGSVDVWVSEAILDWLKSDSDLPIEDIE